MNSTIMFRADLADRLFPIPPRVTFQDWWITGFAAAVTGIGWVDGLRVGYRQHGENGILGATGLAEARPRCRAAEVRRQMLIHSIGDYLTEPELLVAWQAWEHTLRDAVGRFQTVYLPVIATDDCERQQARRHSALADEAVRAGDVPRALRERIRALACDPTDIVCRQWVLDLEWILQAQDGPPEQRDPSGELRSFVTLAYLDELLEEPQLLADYVSMVSDEDDATLAVSAAGLGQELAVKAIASAADGAGLEVHRLPDVLLVTEDTVAAPAQLERRANAALTLRDEELPAPVWQPAGFSRLKVVGRG
jgi:hypothetical protein